VVGFDFGFRNFDFEGDFWISNFGISISDFSVFDLLF